MTALPTREQAADMAAAHAEGLHSELAREGCPECDGRELSAYPVTKPAKPSEAVTLIAQYLQSDDDRTPARHIEFYERQAKTILNMLEGH